jgi:hypothetical protein
MGLRQKHNKNSLMEKWSCRMSVIMNWLNNVITIRIWQQLPLFLPVLTAAMLQEARERQAAIVAPGIVVVSLPPRL